MLVHHGLLYLIYVVTTITIGVPQVLRRPGAKRRRGNPAANLPKHVFVASPDPGSMAGERRWVLRGFCSVSSIEAIDTPSSNQQKIIDEMELPYSVGYDKYEAPVELRVVRSGLLSQPLIVDLQTHAQFCKLPVDKMVRWQQCDHGYWRHDLAELWP